MKFFLIFLNIFIFQLICWSQNKIEINNIDSLGRRQGSWKNIPEKYYDFLEGEEKLNKFKIIRYLNENDWLQQDTIFGNIVEEYNYENDTLNGVFYQRFNDSLILTKGNYKKGKLDGKLKYYNIKVYYSYNQQCKLQPCLPIYECIYSKGKRNGLYYLRGLIDEIEEIGIFLDNELVGPNISYGFYSAKDTVYSWINGIELYDNNKNINVIYRFYSNNALKMIITLKKGRFNKIKYFDYHGYLIREEKWNKSRYIKTYFPKGEKYKKSLMGDEEFMLNWYIEE